MDAAELVAELRPQVVISDLEMPGFGSVATTSAVRNLGLDIPAIVYSGSVEHSAARRCIDAGGVGFVSKMLHLSELLRAIDRAAPGSPMESSWMFNRYLSPLPPPVPGHGLEAIEPPGGVTSKLIFVSRLSHDCFVRCRLESRGIPDT